MNPLKQSRYSVYPVVCMCAREIKCLIKDVFQKVLIEIGETPTTVLPNNYGIIPITLSTNCDMSCNWKLTGRGGAAYLPCTKCSIQSGKLHTETQDKGLCHVCIELGHVNNLDHICSHIPMCTEEHMEKLSKDINGFSSIMPQIAS